MGLLDLLSRLSAPVRATKFSGLNELRRAEAPDVHEPTLATPPAPVVIPDPKVRETLPVQTAPGFLPQRFGTFLVVDLYPGDLGGKPDWSLLEAHSKIDNCEIVGAMLKATEGISYAYTDWFVRNGNQLRDLWRGRLGRDRFMGSYHFLQLARDGRQQAEYYARTMEKIGMPAGGTDMRPMIDFEQGGQHGFFPTDCPKDKDGHYNLALLPDTVKRDLVKRAMDTTRTCADALRSLTGFRPMLYGRGLQRDLGMRLDRGYTIDQLRMGCFTAVNPAYTEHIPPMDAYGWPIRSVGLWQYAGDGKSAHPGLPSSAHGFGDHIDMNVHIDGDRRSSLDSFRMNLVAFQ